MLKSQIREGPVDQTELKRDTPNQHPFGKSHRGLFIK